MTLRPGSITDRHSSVTIAALLPSQLCDYRCSATIAALLPSLLCDHRCSATIQASHPIPPSHSSPASFRKPRQLALSSGAGIQSCNLCRACLRRKIFLHPPFLSIGRIAASHHASPVHLFSKAPERVTACRREAWPSIPRHLVASALFLPAILLLQLSCHSIIRLQRRCTCQTYLQPRSPSSSRESIRSSAFAESHGRPKNAPSPRSSPAVDE